VRGPSPARRASGSQPLLTNDRLQQVLTQSDAGTRGDHLTHARFEGDATALGGEVVQLAMAIAPPALEKAPTIADNAWHLMRASRTVPYNEGCILALNSHAPEIFSGRTRWLQRILLTSGALAALTMGTGQSQAGVSEKAFIRTPNDAAVLWGPCPAFLPKGCGLAVLHGDPAKQNADVLLKVPGGSVLAHHKHTSPERIVMISGEMSVRYDGQQSVRLRPGTYAYGPAGLAHEATCLSKESCVLFIAFVEPVDAIPVAH
jgi:quercetin dioxygenase-like cupin family protein